MSQSPENALKSLLSDLKTYLQQEGPSFVLSRPEEAAYFRKTFTKAAPLPLPEMQAPAAIELPKTTAPQPVAPVTHPPLAVNEVKPVAPPAPPALPPAPSPKTPPPVLEPTHSLPIVSFEEIRKVLGRVAPHLPVLSEIPPDTTAKKIANRWKTKNQTAPITLLYFQESPPQKALLEQITKAIDVYYGPAKLVFAETIEKEKQWETFLSVPELKKVIVCDYTLWQLSDLMRFYKENPTQGTRTLGTVPLFLLPDLSLYLKDPLLKRSLWKALSHQLQPAPPS